jgi:hypothetical protein
MSERKRECFFFSAFTQNARITRIQEVNSRFQSLLFNSTIPIKTDIPTVWKSNFKHYYEDMIIPNKHRVNVLRLSDPFIADTFATPPHLLSTFIRLEILILDNISVKSFDEVLNDINVLPNLHSLIINQDEYGKGVGVFLPKVLDLLELKRLKFDYQFKLYQSPFHYYCYDLTSVRLLSWSSSFDISVVPPFFFFSFVLYGDISCCVICEADDIHVHIIKRRLRSC